MNKSRKKVIIWCPDVIDDLYWLEFFGYIKIIPVATANGEYVLKFILTEKGRKLAEKLVMNLRVWQWEKLKKLVQLSDEEIDKLIERIVEEEEKCSQRN